MTDEVRVIIRGRKEVRFAIPITIPVETKKLADEGDEDAWDEIAREVEIAYDPLTQWDSEDDFDPDDLEIKGDD